MAIGADHTYPFVFATILSKVSIFDDVMTVYCIVVILHAGQGDCEVPPPAQGLLGSTVVRTVDNRHTVGRTDVMWHLRYISGNK